MSSLEVIFLPGEATKTVQVVIIDDNDLEPDLETFFGNLVISSESASIAEVTVPLATVDIMDNDGKYTIQTVLNYFVRCSYKRPLTMHINVDNAYAF